MCDADLFPSVYRQVCGPVKDSTGEDLTNDSPDTNQSETVTTATGNGFQLPDLSEGLKCFVYALNLKPVQVLIIYRLWHNAFWVNK